MATRKNKKLDANKPDETQNAESETGDEISKTQIKKEMHRLQQLGEQLVALSNKEIESLPLSEKLHLALLETRNIRKKEALRRHKQYIGKLMRTENIEPIEAALEEKRLRHKAITDSHHKIEQWRDQILAGQQGIDNFIAAYPEADRQWLQTMHRKSKAELKAEQPPASARKIFAYIRDMVSESRG